MVSGLDRRGNRSVRSSRYASVQSQTDSFETAMLRTVRLRARRARLALAALLALSCAHLHGSELVTLPAGIQTEQPIVARVNGLRITIWPVRSSLSPSVLFDRFVDSVAASGTAAPSEVRGTIRFSYIRGSYHTVVTLRPAVGGSRGELSRLNISQRPVAPRLPFALPRAVVIDRSIESVVAHRSTRVWNVSASMPRQRLLDELLAHAERASWSSIGRTGDAVWLVRRADTLGVTAHGSASRAIAVLTWLVTEARVHDVRATGRP